MDEQTLTLDAGLHALRAGHAVAEGRLDFSYRLARSVLETARGAEREGKWTDARRVYEQLVELRMNRAGDLTIRIARTLELEGRSEEALELLRKALANAKPEARIALERTGRRLARSVGRGWAPQRPLKRGYARDLRLACVGREGGRPAFQGIHGSVAVEIAVRECIEATGRRVIRAEGPFLTTLYGLLLSDVYFLPVAGMLPCRFLSGPLDVGTPLFGVRRSAPIRVLCERIRSGDAESLVQRTWERWVGTRLAGVNWDLASCDEWRALTQGLGPTVLLNILEVLLEQGWTACAGFPDLVVLTGGRARVKGAVPARLSESLLAIEVKAPGDAMRDAQRVWMDWLVHRGVQAEQWQIVAT